MRSVCGCVQLGVGAGHDTGGDRGVLPLELGQCFPPHVITHPNPYTHL